MQVPRIIRSKSPLALLVALTSIVALGATTATAAPTTIRNFEGTTSQELPLSFTVEATGGNAVITQMSFNTLLTCEDGQQISAGHGFFGFNVPIEDGRFQFDFVSVFFALHWRGRISPSAARGTLTDLYPALTAEEQAQLCPTGELTWTAEPVGGGVGAQPRVDVRITTTRDEAGHVTTRVTRTGG